MRSCCHGCDLAAQDKNNGRCLRCEKRLALLDSLDYIAQARTRDAEPCRISAGITRYHGQPETWSG